MLLRNMLSVILFNECRSLEKITMIVKDRGDRQTDTLLLNSFPLFRFIKDKGGLFGRNNHPIVRLLKTVYVLSLQFEGKALLCKATSQRKIKNMQVSQIINHRYCLFIYNILFSVIVVLRNFF